MKHKKQWYFISLCAVAVSMSGCVTISPSGEGVMLYNQQTTLLQGCDRLGPVTATASAWSKLDMDQTAAQAKNDLREKARSEYGADSVAVVNLDQHETSVTAHGIAFRCSKH